MRDHRHTRLAVIIIAVMMVMVFPVLAAAQSTLEQVQSRGTLSCGVNGGLPGFSYLDSEGTWSGFDADYCRAIAAAVLGDGDAVDFVPLTAAERFVALQTGEIDVLIRNTTWTLTRDTEVGVDFVPTTFYDGQGFMVRADIGVSEIEDLAGASVCVTSGTTTELNLADTMRARGVPFTPVVFDEIDTVYNSYEQGRCDAVTSDKSQLAARRSVMADPEAHVILDATISKEPLGPATRHGDDQWRDVITWVVFATFYAEEKGITSANAATISSDDPEMQRFLGTAGDLGDKLGLPSDWAQQVILGVGNYGEMFERHLRPIGLPRGLNAQWTDGGLLYAAPFR